MYWGKTVSSYRTNKQNIRAGKIHKDYVILTPCIRDEEIDSEGCHTARQLQNWDQRSGVPMLNSN